MAINRRSKGARIERRLAKILTRITGVTFIRSAQRKGAVNSADIIEKEERNSWYYIFFIESKGRKQLKGFYIKHVLAKAFKECGPIKIPVIALLLDRKTPIVFIPLLMNGRHYLDPIKFDASGLKEVNSIEEVIETRNKIWVSTELINLNNRYYKCRVMCLNLANFFYRIKPRKSRIMNLMIKEAEEHETNNNDR